MPSCMRGCFVPVNHLLILCAGLLFDRYTSRVSCSYLQDLEIELAEEWQTELEQNGFRVPEEEEEEEEEEWFWVRWVTSDEEGGGGGRE